MRPRSLEEFVGQEQIVGEGRLLRRAITGDTLFSIILWGPPGSGKTTLARIIAESTNAQFEPLSAVSAGVADLRRVVKEAQDRLGMFDQRTVLFIDEIHRFNKAQQDAFLPYVERGDIILIGATTENPSFEVISALLSRAKVYALRPLTEEELVTLLERALPVVGVRASADLLRQIAVYSNGDARMAYNILELASAASKDGEITRESVEDSLQRKVLLYDKSGEEHYNLISALHKSVRSSDVDAALYWLGRMLAAGEDRLYIARRLVRMAIEDIGLADPRALEQAIAAMQTVHFLGEPEGDQALAQIAIYLAAAPKSDAAYRALNSVMEEIQTHRAEPVPLQLRNAPTRPMKDWGYGQGYQHAHKFEDALTDMVCLPESLAGRIFYEPTERGVEQRIKQRLDEIRERRKG